MDLPQVDINDPTPKYVQAERILTTAIREGRLPAGTKLPATSEIGAKVNVSLITAQKALLRLVEAGLVRREVGRGTFVREGAYQSATEESVMSIGLVLDRQVNIDDFYHRTVIDRLRRAASQCGDRSDFFFLESDASQRVPRRPNVGLLALYPSVSSRARIAELAAKIPTVVLGSKATDHAVAAVDCDNRQGARLAVEHLAGLGHRRMAVLSGPQNQSTAIDRVAGLRAAFAELAIPLDPRDVLISHDSVFAHAGLMARLKHRLRAEDRPTGILATGYFMAIEALRAAREIGVRVPADVSLIGFDDPPSAPMLQPPLTTLRHPLEAMADQAYALLARTVRGARPTGGIQLFPMELKVRRSTIARPSGDTPAGQS